MHSRDGLTEQSLGSVEEYGEFEFVDPSSRISGPRQKEQALSKSRADVPVEELHDLVAMAKDDDLKLTLGDLDAPLRTRTLPPST